MILTYKRKGTSLNACSFYERLCGHSLAECSDRSTNIEDRLPNGCCSSRENKKDKCQGRPKSELFSSSKFYQSQSSEGLDAPPIKFKYTRRAKELHKSGGRLQNIAALPLTQEERQSISKIDTAHRELARLCCGPCLPNHCGNDATRPCGSLPSQNFTREDNHLEPLCSIMSANEPTATVSHIADPLGMDTEDISSFQNGVELVAMKCAAPIQTYSRRSRDNEDSHRTYAAQMTERSTFFTCDRTFSKNVESHVPVQQAVVKTMELSESEIVEEHSCLFCQSVGKMTHRVSSVGNMSYCQGNQKVRNGYLVFDDTNVSAIPSLNDEAVTGQPDNTIKPHKSICELSLHTASEEHSKNTVMADTYEAIIGISQNHSDDLEKAGAASNDSSGCAASLHCSVLDVSYSDKRSDVNPAPSIKYHEVAPLQSESLQQSAEENQAASVHAEVPNYNSKELLGTVNQGIKKSNGLFDINIKPSKDAVSDSPENKMADQAASPNDSKPTKILQLFPEDATVNALRHNTSKSELDPAIPHNSGSVTVALHREIIQDNVAQSSSNQARHKLLQDSFRNSNKPQMEATEGFCQKFQPFASVWCEEELDNLWVGVRRHGKDNWYAMLRDPRLRFASWRTARDLNEKWIVEQTKLSESTPGPQDQPSNPVGIPLDSYGPYGSSVPPFMPPGPGFMTRFLTDPMQLSLSNSLLNKQSQGMFPPRPPHNSNSLPGNGTRLVNRRIRAHRKSQRQESTWGRFKVTNQVMPPSPLPTSLVSTSRINILPSYIRDAMHYPHSFPTLPVPPLSSQHLSNRSSFHNKLSNNVIGSYSQNSAHLSNTVTDSPTIPAFPETQQTETKSTNPKRQEESINLEIDASSEETISDDDKPRLTSK